METFSQFIQEKHVEEVHPLESSKVGGRVNQLRNHGYKITTAVLGIGVNRKHHLIIRAGTSGDNELKKFQSKRWSYDRIIKRYFVIDSVSGNSFFPTESISRNHRKEI